VQVSRGLPLVLVAGTVAACCSGCALHKPPSTSAIVGQALPKATPLPPKWSATPDSDNVADGWLASFGDDGLNSVVNESIANNLDLRQAAQSVEVARQGTIVAGAKLKPQIGASFGGAATAADTKSGENYPSNSELVGASWEVDIWGRLRAQHAATQANYEAVATDYAFARQSLAATTAKAWYQAIETHQLLVLTEESVRIYAKLLELVKIRRDAGRVADLDVAEASYQLNEARNQLLIMQGMYSESRRTLELLIGRYPAAELQVAEAFVPLPRPVPPGLPSSLLERRPDIVSAQHQVEAAFYTNQAAKLALLPSFTLSLQAGRLSDILLSVLSLNPWLAHGAVGMSVPIYQGGALRAQIKIATAQQAQSVAHYGAVALRSFAEVEIALTNEQLMAQRLVQVENGVGNHREAVGVANLKYSGGSIDMLSLLQLQEGLIQSEAELIKLRNAQLANRINLHLALGGSFDNLPAATFPPVVAAK